ncbi:hypothetical protein PC116_g14636 [Phytophthora cactorum]|nr:hypothetical protein PC116_g14636 [Phytophthora cactorum]
MLLELLDEETFFFLIILDSVVVLVAVNGDSAAFSARV